jgi:16S rRNA (guanine966-N2)-methyltransferase
MRIVSGKFKGRRIPVRKNFPSRPTTDFAKENLFNVLGNQFDFEGLYVLDLFSGTGSMSYEFASRGANVELIEKDYHSFVFIQNTIASLEFKTIKPYKADVFRALHAIHRKYDLIFADPPYTLKTIQTIPDLIFEHSLLKDGGWFILEHSSRNIFNAHPDFKETRKYGSVHFSIFVKKEETAVE